VSVTLEVFNLVYKLDEIDKVAEQLIDKAKSKKIWFFKGQMGAGKTTLIKEICTLLGVGNEMSSPTFSLVNEYHTNKNKKIFHFDLYRLNNISELNQIGFQEYLDSGNYCLIEWPELLPPIDGVFTIEIKATDENREVICY